MPIYAKRILYWLPRLSGLLAVFFMLFLPLGFYNNNVGLLANFRETAIYLLPSLIFMAVILIAWNWPGIGSLVLIMASLFIMAYFKIRNGTWQLIIALPIMFLGIMFGMSKLMNFKFSMSRFIRKRQAISK